MARRALETNLTTVTEATRAKAATERAAGPESSVTVAGPLVPRVMASQSGNGWLRPLEAGPLRRVPAPH
jgi:hypothetical protein